jgi:hypothetical protein
MALIDLTLACLIFARRIMKDRHKLERQQGKDASGTVGLAAMSTDELTLRQTPAIKELSKKFGIAHGVSSLLVCVKLGSFRPDTIARTSSSSWPISHTRPI